MGKLRFGTKLMRVWEGGSNRIEQEELKEPNFLGWFNYTKQMNKYWQLLALPPSKAIYVALAISICSFTSKDNDIRLFYTMTAIIYFFSLSIMSYFIRFYESKWWGQLIGIIFFLPVLLCITAWCYFSFYLFRDQFMAFFKYLGLHNRSYLIILFLLFFIAGTLGKKRIVDIFHNYKNYFTEAKSLKGTIVGVVIFSFLLFCLLKLIFPYKIYLDDGYITMVYACFFLAGLIGSISSGLISRKSKHARLFIVIYLMMGVIYGFVFQQYCKTALYSRNCDLSVWAFVTVSFPAIFGSVVAESVIKKLLRKGKK